MVTYNFRRALRAQYFKNHPSQIAGSAPGEKSPHIFRPPLSAEYVTVFSGRTDAPEVRCDLQRQTDRQDNPPAHARRGLITNPSFAVC